jgi:hypothetical protein
MQLQQSRSNWTKQTYVSLSLAKKTSLYAALVERRKHTQIALGTLRMIRGGGELLVSSYSD